MRRKTLIFLLLGVFIFMMADTNMPLFKRKNKQAVKDSLEMSELTASDSLETDSLPVDSKDGVPDTAKMDSLELAIYKHNKAVDDSIKADSVFRAKAGGIDAPVTYEAQDSLVYDAATKTAHLYGKAKVKYTNMDLSSEKVYMSLDSSIVHATGVADTAGNLSGTPVFKMGSDTYENDTMAFNFKSKKGLISNVYTEQEDGFLRSQRAKRDSSGALYLTHGRYTTCDEEHPDFYIALSRAKVRPGKDVVFGPAYLVVADVPLPLAIPYGFFPFTKSYSSGFIMPTYGDESSRGFYLRDGGYYFAMSDKWDLKVLGEIYTKGSWGLSAASNYRKRYRYNGSFMIRYQDTKNGDKGMPDFTEEESFKVQWQHHQDPKANPFTNFSASVNFATSSFERNNLSSLYNPQAMTQSQRMSNVSWTTTFSSIGMTLSGGVSLNQNMRDSVIDLTLPDLNITVARFFPFKRKKAAGDERWYEKIAFRYTGRLSNTISTKENKLLHSSLTKDWKNGMEHRVPISASFTLFNYLTITPQLNLTDRMYLNKANRSWDADRQVEKIDTVRGFYNVFDWDFSIQANTKLYGFFIPNRKIFGDKVQAIRHMFTPSVSFNFHPDFGAEQWGIYKTYTKTDADGNVSLVRYSPYSGMGISSPPGIGRSGSISMSINNNLEMKIKSDKDSTGVKKISLIDELGASMSYNMAAKVRPWSDLDTHIRLKLSKSYTFNMSASFATYAYELDENDRPYVGTRTEYSYGRFGRFKGTSQTISYTLNPEKIKKFFGGKKDDDDKKRNEDDDYDTGVETNIDDDLEKGKHGAERKGGKAETDADGYVSFSMPWSITFGYGITMSENTGGTFNKERMRYPYMFTQNLNISGNIRISEGWNINFVSGYDFNFHKLSMTTASLSRDLHCFNMSCSVVLAPYTSYNFSFRCNAATLTDALKYDKRSGYTNAVQWY